MPRMLLHRMRPEVLEFLFDLSVAFGRFMDGTLAKDCAYGWRAILAGANLCV